MAASLEAQNCQDKDQLSKVTQSLRDMMLSHANEMEKLHAAQDTINEERTRCDALVRRHQLNATFLADTQGLKTQLAELETQHEALVKVVSSTGWHYSTGEKMINALRQSLHLAKPSCTPPTTLPHGVVKRRVYLSPRERVHSSTSRHNMNVLGAPTDAVRPLCDL
ncbi:hypothetical protein H310_06991 [Aphanomyces invadans]|uniref:Uncharacterized protein n=1 Tax=Aphanomyces invadans TaxID=157072 RepID=A0A024U5J6_9STRA|nr:hypothetical protein H310_06991 [Aphanomyces invadans]ETW01480.1 hypothetical protein H310_06991 [Aphanomyces invadans]|eukprot:XP_008870478.1 hypothetical protein H310_06991 [Aphanomyces invadans]